MTGGDRGSTGSALAGGALIGLLCLPLLILAVPAGAFVAWRLLAAVTHRPVFAYVTLEQPGGLEVLASVVGAFTVGVIVALLMSVPTVKFVVRGADPRLLFRTGALALAATASALWWWISDGGAMAPAAHAVTATLAWLGTLAGLRFACTYTDAARRAHDARALPDRMRLGLPPLGDDGRARSAGPWDQGPG